MLPPFARAYDYGILRSAKFLRFKPYLATVRQDGAWQKRVSQNMERPMAFALEYREFASQQLNAAQSAALPLVRERHLQAAERWQQLAEEHERFEQPPGAMGRQDYFY
jgi:hypothetical protein